MDFPCEMSDTQTKAVVSCRLFTASSKPLRPLTFLKAKRFSRASLLWAVRDSKNVVADQVSMIVDFGAAAKPLPTEKLFRFEI